MGRNKIDIAAIAKNLPADKEYYTVAEIVQHTGLNRKTVLARLNDGTLKGKMLGRSWRIYRSSLISEGEKEHEN